MTRRSNRTLTLIITCLTRFCVLGLRPLLPHIHGLIVSWPLLNSELVGYQVTSHLITRAYQLPSSSYYEMGIGNIYELSLLTKYVYGAIYMDLSCW